MLRKIVSVLLVLTFCFTALIPCTLAEDSDEIVTAEDSSVEELDEEGDVPLTETDSKDADVAEPEGTDPGTPSSEPVVTVIPAVTPEPTVSPEPEYEGPAYLVKDQRVTMGADLTDAQRRAVYKDFGIEMGSVKELKVTNKEERSYLEGLVSEKRIGKVALSCSYITVLDEGAGLEVKLHNINYCTEEMYKNALKTAGITDARVIVSAPYPVSGTGALTGIYKAYEDVTGQTLSDLAKAVGAEELVITGDLSEYIGSKEASKLISELKNILDKTKDMSDEEVRKEIQNLAKAYNVSLTSSQEDQILNLCRKLEGLDEGELKSKLSGLAATAQTVNKVSETVSEIFESVTGFFKSVGDFFVNLFS